MKRELWNIANFDRVNLPEVIGKLTIPSLFSKQRGIRVLDMPIHMPGQGWKIPEQLQYFLEPISMAARKEQEYGDLDQHYVYVTVDQKEVVAGKTGRRAGAHSDAYIEEQNSQIDITHENADVIAQETGEVSHTYVLYDCLPTEFFDARFPLHDTSCAGSLKTFDEIAEQSDVVTYPIHTLLRLSPFVVHRCAVCNETQPRTFMKISVSKKRYARKGNTINALFDYDWEMTARSTSERNHPWT